MDRTQRIELNALRRSPSNARPARRHKTSRSGQTTWPVQRTLRFACGVFVVTASIALWQPAARGTEPESGWQESANAIEGGNSLATAAARENSSGSATKIIATKTLFQVVRDGGPLMIPIGACSFILLVFIFERSISLRRGRIIPRHFVKRLLEQLREAEIGRDEAISLCQKNRSPVAEVFEAALQKWDKPSVEVEQAIIDSGERVTNGLRRYLRLINGIATVSPLLGLLGTVLGMIHAFDAIAVTDSQARPEVTIATGISQALLTTAAGLSVAIPALIAHLYFVGRVDRLVVEVDSLGQKLVNVIASDAYRPAAASEANSDSRGERRRRSKAA